MSDIRPGDMLCLREGCNHPASFHRLDDSTNVSPNDPDADFRCIGYDCEAPGPFGSCEVECPDFLPPPEWEQYWMAQNKVEPTLVRRNVFDQKEK